MEHPLDRRRFLTGLAALPVLPALGLMDLRAPRRSPPSGEAPSHFPHQDPALVSEVVGASHRDLDRVRQLVEARPALARASWDWGFGDWECALGAASHVGRPDIAELLMAHGARPNHFTWAMLGRVDAVRAVVQASPGVATITGPHGITLLAHARAGGDAAAAVVDYLEGLGTADPRPVAVPLSVDEVAAFVGTYAFGPGAGARLEVTERRGGLQIRPGQGVARVLVHRGRGSFHPAGVPSVRVVFAGSDGPAASLTVIDGDVRLEAPRMP